MTARRVWGMLLIALMGAWGAFILPYAIDLAAEGAIVVVIVVVGITLVAPAIALARGRIVEAWAIFAGTILIGGGTCAAIISAVAS